MLMPPFTHSYPNAVSLNINVTCKCYIPLGNTSRAETINNEIDFDAHKLKAPCEEKKSVFSVTKLGNRQNLQTIWNLCN